MDDWNIELKTGYNTTMSAILLNLDKLLLIYQGVFYELASSQEHLALKDGVPNDLEDMLPNGSPLPKLSTVSVAKKITNMNHTTAKQGW